MAPLDDTAPYDLLDVLDDRYGRRGTLLTSQVPIDHWHHIVWSGRRPRGGGQVL